MYGLECDYIKVFYDYICIVMFINKDICLGIFLGMVEFIFFVYQFIIIGGFMDVFYFYFVIVCDFIVIIYLYNNMLEYGYIYYVIIDNGVLNLVDGSF